MIYLTKEDWSKYLLPKLSDDKLFIEEFKQLLKIRNVILYFSHLLFSDEHNSEKVYRTALTFFHKYHISSNYDMSKASPYELYILIGACILLSQKITNVFLGGGVIKIAECLKEKIIKKYSGGGIEKKQISDNIKKKELEILCSIGFNTEVDLPYIFLPTVQKYLKELNIPYLNVDRVIELINIYINESLILPIYIYYLPDIVCISCVKLLTEKFNNKSISIQQLISLSQFPIEINDINECYLIIKRLQILIEYNKKNKNINSNKNNINNNNTLNNNINLALPSMNNNYNNNN